VATDLTPEILNGITAEKLDEIFETLGDLTDQYLERDGPGGGGQRFDEAHKNWLVRNAEAVLRHLVLTGGRTMTSTIFAFLRAGYMIAHHELERQKEAVEELTR